MVRASTVTASLQATRLDGAVALVTGAGGRIGAAIVESLTSAGATVVATDLSFEPGAPADHAACDVTDPMQVDKLVSRVVADHDGLDIVVHCAGITRDGMLWKLADSDWNSVIQVNLDSAFYLLRAAAPHLRRSPRAAAVLISSINGQRGKLGQSNYAASKAGLIGLAMSAARELGRDGVRVNAVAPGFIESAMTEALDPSIRERAVAESVLGRIGVPEDVAGAVLFLCCGLARHITGQVLRVDGGQLIA